MNQKIGIWKLGWKGGRNIRLLERKILHLRLSSLEFDSGGVDRWVDVDTNI